MTPGPTLSTVVAGTMHLASWNFSVRERHAWVEACLGLGITSFDHADIYGDYQGEVLFGEVLARTPTLRDRMTLVTKCGIRLLSAARPAHRLKSYDASAAHIMASVEASLRALQTDRLDLLLLHRPDALLEPDEVAGAFSRLKQAGKVLAFGVSNFSAAQFALLNSVTPLLTNQIELHPLHREPLHDGTLDQLLAHRLRPMVWSPLAGGRLLQPVADQRSPEARVQWVLGELSARLGVPRATVAYAWCLRHPSRPHLITGTRRVEGLEQAVAAQQLHLSREDWTALWQAGAGHELA